MSLNEGRECSLGALKYAYIWTFLHATYFKNLPAVDHGLIDQQRASRRWW